jgi:CheY-like chemotaxis protein
LFKRSRLPSWRTKPHGGEKTVDSNPNEAIYLQQVRALGPESGGEIPALALTAYARDQDRRDALASGFQAYLPKPMEPEQLVAVIADLARTRQG